MLTDLQRDKLMARFDLLDEDCNGLIEADDYDRVAMRLAAAFGYQPGSPVELRVHDAYMELWRRLQARADLDRDERVTRDEFVSSVAESIVEREDGFDRVMHPVTDAVFDLCDTDGDGRLSAEEYSRCFDIYGVPRAESVAAFERLDSDGSGFLPRGEIEAALQDFYVSADPDAPGNLIFGRL